MIPSLRLHIAHIKILVIHSSFYKYEYKMLDFERYGMNKVEKCSKDLENITSAKRHEIFPEQWQSGNKHSLLYITVKNTVCLFTALRG